MFIAYKRQNEWQAPGRSSILLFLTRKKLLATICFMSLVNGNSTSCSNSNWYARKKLVDLPQTPKRSSHHILKHSCRADSLFPLLDLRLHKKTFKLRKKKLSKSRICLTSWNFFSLIASVYFVNSSMDRRLRKDKHNFCTLSNRSSS